MSHAPFCPRLDQLGAGLSLACAVHCLLTPLLGPVLAVSGLSFLVDTMTEMVLLSFAVILALSNLCWGFRLHKSGRPLSLLAAAVVAITAGRLYDAQEIPLVAAGAVILATSHLLNRRLCQTCLHCRQADQPAPA